MGCKNTIRTSLCLKSLNAKISVFHKLFLDSLFSTKSQCLETPPYTLQVTHTEQRSSHWYLRTFTASYITFHIQHVKLTSHRHPCTTLDDQEGFKCTIHLRSWTKEPPNTSLVLDSLCSNMDTYVPALQQVCPQRKAAKLLCCSVLAVQCCCKTQRHCNTQRPECTHWNKSKLSTVYFRTHTLF